MVFSIDRGRTVGAGASVPIDAHFGVMRSDVLCDQIRCRAPVTLSCKMALQGQIGWTVRTDWTARNSCKSFIWFRLREGGIHIATYVFVFKHVTNSHKLNTPNSTPIENWLGVYPRRIQCGSHIFLCLAPRKGPIQFGRLFANSTATLSCNARRVPCLPA